MSNQPRLKVKQGDIENNEHKIDIFHFSFASQIVFSYYKLFFHIMC